MKKTLSIILTLALMLTVLPLGLFTIPTAAATSGTTGDCTWTLNGTVLTISGNGKMGDYSSRSVNGNSITTAPWGASITNVIIEDGVTSIGNYAFYKCTSLTSVTIGDSITSIGDYAFFYCTSLTSITIPDGVTYIGAYAFCYCGVNSVLISNSVKGIGYGAFGSCYNLSKVNITDMTAWCSIEFESIGSNPLYYAENLYLNDVKVKNLVIPADVSIIDEFAFYQFNNFNTINVENGNEFYHAKNNCLIETATNTLIMGCNNSIIPDYVTSIGDCAFYGCTGLESVTIPNGVTSIVYGAFANCTALKNVTLGNNVTSIVYDAFSDCSALTSINLPNGLESIGENAFYNCSSLNKITFSKNVTYIGYSAFDYCNNLQDVFYTGDKINQSSISIGYYNDSLINATWHYNSCIAENHSYNEYKCSTTCLNCGFERQNNNPHTFDNISDYICNVCSEYSFEESGTTGDCYWGIKNNILTIYGNGKMGDYSEKYVNGNYITTAPWGVSITEVIIEDGVTSIGKYAFYNCSSLTSIVIPDTVTTIGNSAFSRCYSLTSIVIPNSVTMIEGYAFSNCSSLTSLVIPDSVTTIGHGAFSDCISIENVTIGEGVEIIYGDAFYNCESLEILNYNAIAADCYWDSSGDSGIGFSKTKLKTVNIGKSVKEIPTYFLMYCDGIENIIIPNNVTHIHTGAFYRCEGLNSITIGTGVKYFGMYIFESCYSLSEIHITDLKAWCEIDNYEFNNLFSDGAKLYLNGYELEGDIVIPEGTTSIGNYAFANCYFITSITIPDSVQSIGRGSFYACRSLTEIVLPENITEIPDYAFFDCRFLETIVIKGKVTSVGNYAFENDYLLKNVYFAGSKRDYILMDIGSNNSPLFMAKWVYDYVTEPSTPHVCEFGDWEVVTEATVDADGLKIKKCACGEEITAVIPRILVIKNQTLALQSNISIVFRVDPVYFTKHGYENPVVTFTFLGVEYPVTEYTVNASGLYEYAFNVVAPHQMKETVYAVLTAENDGVVYTSPVKEYSIYTYCNNQISKNSTNAAYKKLIALLVDILNYGAAAQTYQNYKTTDLANAELTAAQKALGNQDVIEYADEKQLQNAVVDGGIADIKTVGLTLQDSVIMNFKFELLNGATKDGLVAVVKAAGKTWEIDASEFVYESSSKRFVINFNGLNPAQMREKVSIHLEKDGVIVSDTATYSVESYGLSTAAKGNAKLAALVETMARYGRSAKAYNG